ncbi:MAG TPA: hypothetical protein VK778_04090, partial [Solirubrobacteraceae bacterium]|nr:hypothetical protein [Solirubrobacteraceae bacterium]
TVAGLSVQGGVLTGAGAVDVTGSFTGGGFGSLTGSGSTVLEAGATGTIMPGSQSINLVERTLSNAGTLTIGTESGLEGFKHARLVNSGTLVVNGEGVGENHGLDAGEGEASLTNTGTLEKTEGGGVAPVGFAIDNEGLVRAEAGQLDFDGGGNSDGSVSGSWAASGAGSDIVFDAGSREPFSLGATVAVSGAIEVAEGDVTAGVIEGPTASVALTGGGTLEVTSTLDASTVEGLSVERGLLGGAGTLDVTGSFVGGGYGGLVGSGSTVLEAGTVGVIASSVTMEERELSNAGTLTIDSEGELFGRRQARLFNSGTMVVNGEGLAQGHGLQADEGEASLTNTGTLEKTEGSGVSPVGFAIDNEGVVQAKSGQLEFTGGGNSGQLTPDIWSAAPGASLTLGGVGGATYLLGASTTLAGNIAVDGKVSAGAIEGSDADLTLLNGQLTLVGLTPSVLGALSIAPPESDYDGYREQVVSVTDELDINTSLTWSSALMEFVGPGAIVAGPESTTLLNSPTQINVGGGELVNEGTATWASGSLDTSRHPASPFFVNLGTFLVDQGESTPAAFGCDAEGEERYACPLFENEGIFTARTKDGNIPHIPWAVDLVNYGQLEVPYAHESACPWEFSEYPGPGTEACWRSNEEYRGILLTDGGTYIETALCEEGEACPGEEGTEEVESELSEEEGEEEGDDLVRLPSELRAYFAAPDGASPNDEYRTTISGNLEIPAFTVKGEPRPAIPVYVLAQISLNGRQARVTFTTKPPEDVKYIALKWSVKVAEDVGGEIKTSTGVYNEPLDTIKFNIYLQSPGFSEIELKPEYAGPYAVKPGVARALFRAIQCSGGSNCRFL